MKAWCCAWMALGAAHLALGGCAAKEAITFNLSFSYQSLGAGPEAILDRIILVEGAEHEAVSNAITAALQDLQYGIVQPEVDVGELLPQRKWIVTDPVRQDGSLIREHNRLFPALRLEVDRHYELYYKLRYAVLAKKLAIKTYAMLRYRFASGESHDYPGPYSSKFFVDRLRKEIIAKLKQERVSPGSDG